jgi:hypothetical protein
VRRGGFSTHCARDGSVKGKGGVCRPNDRRDIGLPLSVASREGGSPTYESAMNLSHVYLNASWVVLRTYALLLMCNLSFTGTLLTFFSQCKESLSKDVLWIAFCSHELSAAMYIMS